MLVASGQIVKLAGDLTVENIPLAFDPHSVWLFAFKAGTNDLAQSEGIVFAQTGNHTVVQSNWNKTGLSTWEANNYVQFDSEAVYVFDSPNGTSLGNVASFDAALGNNEWTLTPNAVDFDVTIWWTALDEDAAVGGDNALLRWNANPTFNLNQRGPAFVSKVHGHFLTRPTAGAGYDNTLALTSMGLGKDAGPDFGFLERTLRGYSSIEGTLQGFDTSQGGYAAGYRNNNSATFASMKLTAGAAGVLEGTIVDSDSSFRFMAPLGFAGRNGADVECGTFQCPTTPTGKVAITGLGFQPKFVLLRLVQGKTSYVLSGTEDISQNMGLVFGEYSDPTQRSYAWTQGSGTSSSNLDVQTSSNALTMSSPFTGTALLTPTADGFELDFLGHDGTEHIGFFLAFGEPSGPVPFVGAGNLSAANAGLAGTARQPSIGDGAFVAENAVMTGASSWTAPDFTGVGSLSAGESSLDGTADVTEPVFDSSGDFQVSPALLSGLAEAISAPGTFAASGAFVSEAAGLEGTAGFTPQDIVSSGAFTAELAILNGAASTFEEAVFPAAGAFSAELAQLAGSAITANTLIADGGFVCELASLRGTTFLDPTDELGIVIGSIATRPSLRAEVNVNDTG